MKQIYIICLCLILSTYIQAQEKPPKGKFFIEAAIGGEATVSSPSANNLAGFLLKDGNRDAGVLLRIQHFLSDNWGYFLTAQFYESDGYYDLPQKIQPDRDKYYTVNNRYEANKGSSENYLAGGIYRIDFRRFSIRPYFGIGVSKVKTDIHSFDLKGKGNNEVLKSVYAMNDKKITSFCASPGLNLVWKVGTGIHFFGDVSYIHHFGSYKATHTVTDGYTGKQIKEESQKASLPNLLSIKVGISIPLWKYSGNYRKRK
ncbi:autotransporter outer membrane beta-barrel domain-containing protein [Bacteroides sp. 519]|uniref:autotransporter outer membrane beta-barrel domain-containing protein n=1 Tax=Bacteroides sp. 519 TaxID=2302937 RepID=UPI0013D7072F|nr:autotransporter outer membrane beta-barrel domain-containing protein [Bacteroides sp. 519]NDV56583.1 hypothetical protein [Bacteroides sp. 519]